MNRVIAELTLCHIYAPSREAENRLRMDVAYNLTGILRSVGMELECCNIARSNEKLAGLEVVLSSSADEYEFFSLVSKDTIETSVLKAVNENQHLCRSKNIKRISVLYRKRQLQKPKYSVGQQAPMPPRHDEDIGLCQGFQRSQFGKNINVSESCYKNEDKSLNSTVADDIATLRTEVNWARYDYDDDIKECVVAEKLFEVPVTERKSAIALSALKAIKNGRSKISLGDLQSAVDTIQQRKSDTDENYLEQLALRFISRRPRYTFDTIVLPKETLEELDIAVSIVDADVLARYNDWGLNALDPNPRAILNFYGPPGTGKTHAAEALAHRLGKEIIVVGCKELESKWLGEGPKNVAAAFLAARHSGAVLFFDEADGLISQRQLQEQSGGENQLNAVKNAMLTEVECHRGIVVFASNFVEKYDSAFATRIQSFEFTAPTKETLVKIWKTKIPVAAPGHDSLDFNALAELTFKYGFCGRDVRNAAVRAFKTVLRSKRGVISQNDLILACEALIKDRRNMERSNNTHQNTMKTDGGVSASEKKLEKAIGDFVRSNETNNTTPSKQ